jgi:menaquinone-dependent protoporphyrinogen oxidase
LEPTPKDGTSRRALVAFGTKYGTTAKVAEEIAAGLRAKGMETTVVDLRNANGTTMNGYDLVVIGSSIMMDKWTKDALQFLERSRPYLSQKKVAMFVTCGNVLTGTESIETYRRRYLDDVAAKYGIVSPYQKGLFGGVVDFNAYNPLIKAIIKKIWKEKRKELEAEGVDFSKPYDFRDWDAIKAWVGTLGAN